MKPSNVPYSDEFIVRKLNPKERSIFKWGVFRGGELFEGFTEQWQAIKSADEYNQESKQTKTN